MELLLVKPQTRDQSNKENKANNWVPTLSTSSNYDIFVPSKFSTSNLMELSSVYPTSACQPNFSIQIKDP